MVVVVSQEVTASLLPGVVFGASTVLEHYERLTHWDMCLVRKYLLDKGAYSQDEIECIETEYKKFLALRVAYKNVVISKKLDDFWHAHILFTQDYSAMCDTVFGEYVHHRPHLLDPHEVLAIDFGGKTLELYAEHFGAPDRTLWNICVCRCD